MKPGTPWKFVLGCLCILWMGIPIPTTGVEAPDPHPLAAGLGTLTALILKLALGIWLIRSGWRAKPTRP
jgi:hypothetical protein